MDGSIQTEVEAKQAAWIQGQQKLTALPTAKSDRDRAAEARANLRPLLEECAEVLNAAQRDGITVTFALVRDGYGRWAPGTIDCVKPL